MPSRESSTFEIVLSVLAITATVVSSVFALQEIVSIFVAHAAQSHGWAAARQALFAGIACTFIYGGLVYQSTRLAYLVRRRRHERRANPLSMASANAPTVTILVPSYKEDASVIERTLYSAALQQYPNCKVVLLIDDPPSTKPADIALAEAARALPRRIAEELEKPAALCRTAQAAMAARAKEAPLDLLDEARRLAALHGELACWFGERAAAHPVNDVADRFFVDQVFRALEKSHTAEAEQAWALAESHDAALSIEEIGRRYEALVAIMTVELSSFERKQYENLSHEPNKAMNLNSYIGLLGRTFRSSRGPAGLRLGEARPGAGTLSFARPDFLLTLDADSVLLPTYLQSLIPVMQADSKIAVAQTPYSAFPGASGLLERIAGATTDIQYIVHQGFTHFRATYWVGANAVLRMDALADIAEDDVERGHPIRRFIQDRTVIEDSESSIDLVAKGWTLHNHPERLAYSATPPDFGSLVIQRERWANGGLIILPKLLRYAFGRRGATFSELVMRLHYLISITLVNVGLVLCLTCSFGDSIRSAWLPLTALPYYALYWRDMVRLGYRVSDFLGVYALNLLLVPVNLMGVLRSVAQLITGAKSSFKRTPKVADRTTTSPSYLLCEAILFLHCVVGGLVELYLGRTSQGVFALINGAIWGYGLFALIGAREAVEDVSAWFVALRARRAARVPALAAPAPVLVAAASTPIAIPMPIPSWRDAQVAQKEPRAALRDSWRNKLGVFAEDAPTVPGRVAASTRRHNGEESVTMPWGHLGAVTMLNVDDRSSGMLVLAE